jgi:ribosome-binding ATPase YchF (GTP1/OBG family)
MLADLESLERRTEQTRKRAAAKDKEALTVLPMMEGAEAASGRQTCPHHARSRIAAEDLAILQGLNLLTSHPVLYVCNVSEEDAATGNAHTRRGKDGCRTGRRKRRHFRGHRIRGRAARRGSQRIPLGPRPRGTGPRPAYPRRLPASRPDHLFHRRPQGNPRLDGRAWYQGARGGRRHPHRFRTRLHPRLQTIAYDDYVALGGEVPAKEAGKARDEGKEYVVQDGDVIHFRFNT